MYSGFTVVPGFDGFDLISSNPMQTQMNPKDIFF